VQRPRLTVRRSSVHGRGAFARTDIAAGDVIADYRGEVIDWPEANRRYQQRDAAHGHTFYFDLGDGRVIDGEAGGNSARWINHACEPNCEAHVEDEQVVIRAVRDIAAGDELFLDYQLQVDLEHEQDADAVYACRCGTSSCRATMLALD
jgi:SET domain-containing protein